MKKNLAIILFMSFATVAHAQTVADVSNNVFNQLSSGGGVLSMMEAFAYVMGVFLGVKAALKLKEHNESKGQIKLHVPIILCVASAIFLAMPTAISVGYQFLGLNNYAAPSASKDKFETFTQPYLKY